MSKKSYKSPEIKNSNSARWIGKKVTELANEAFERVRTIEKASGVKHVDDKKPE